MQIIPLNLDSVILFLHNSKLGYYISLPLLHYNRENALFNFSSTVVKRVHCDSNQV